MRNSLFLCALGLPLVVWATACSSDEEKSTGATATGGVTSTGGVTGNGGTSATGGTSTASGGADASSDANLIDGNAGGTTGDGATTDGAPTDGALGDGSSAACAALFGLVPGYVFCAEGATTCTFYTNTGASFPDGNGMVTCDSVCQGLGKTCAGGANNATVGTPDCTTPTSGGCNNSFQDQICECTK